jgi:hypothetical protein
VTSARAGATPAAAFSSTIVAMTITIMMRARPAPNWSRCYKAIGFRARLTVRITFRRPSADAIIAAESVLIDEGCFVFEGSVDRHRVSS